MNFRGISFQALFTIYRTRKAIRYSMKSKGAARRGAVRGGAGRRVQEVHTHLTCILPARLTERVWFTKFQSSLLNVYFRLSRFQSLLLLIYFQVGIGVYTAAPKYGRKRIRYVTLHFQDRLGSASLCNRNGAEQKPCHDPV